MGKICPLLGYSGQPDYCRRCGTEGFNRFVDIPIEQRGINQVDYVWLTHLHIDHAGGLAPFLERFPAARAVAHAKGLAHLIDPSKLWEGSLATLKEKALAYGPIEPVAPERLIPHDALSMEGLTILETPGHAPFHLSFCYEDLLFAGESAGVYLPLGDQIYLRPPTPPRFFFEQTVGSVDRMLLLKDQPIYFGHAGSHPSSQKMLKLYREQLYLWKEIIAEIFKSNPEDVLKRSLETLLEKDPLLKYFHQLEATGPGKGKVFYGQQHCRVCGLSENSIFLLSSSPKSTIFFCMPP